MTTDSYNPATARTAYFPDSTNSIARLWTREKTLQDLADLGIVSYFEGVGDDPTGISGYSTSKLWLRPASAGVSTESGTVRYYAGGTASLLASWPTLTKEAFAAYLSTTSISSLLTTRGDMIRRSASEPERLALGTSGYHLQSDGTDAVWSGFLQAGTGAVTRTWQAKLRDCVSVRDFGALGDASNDDTAEIQAAIDSGATSIYFPPGTYKITSTLLVSEKIGLHIFGDSGGSNGLGSSKIYWAGSANGVIFQLYSSSSCCIERLAFQGIYGGIETNPGTGILINGTNADGSVHHNTFRNLSVSAISGTPGYGILFGSATNDDIADNVFDKILIVDAVVGLVQWGNQTVHNLYRDIQCLEFTSKGMQFIDGDVRMEHCSFFGTSAATVDVEVGTGCLWATIRDSYHEILTGRNVSSSSAYSFPTGTRAYGTRLDSCRVLWDIASGNIINYLHRGPVTLADPIIDGTGAGQITITVGGATVRPVQITGPTYVATVTESVTGAASRLNLDGAQIVPQVQTSVLSANATGTDVNTAQPWFGNATGQDALTVKAATTYKFEGWLVLTRSAGTTSHQMSQLFGGTASLTSIMYEARATSTTGAPIASTTPSQMYGTAATALTVTGASTSDTEHITLRVTGTVRINAAGTFIPQFQYSAAPGGAPTILADSYFSMWPVGSNTVQTVGAWA